jgi:hypothetical protein
VIESVPFGEARRNNRRTLLMGREGEEFENAGDVYNRLSGPSGYKMSESDWRRRSYGMYTDGVY